MWYDDYVNGGIGEESWIKSLIGADKSGWTAGTYQAYMDMAQQRMYDITYADPTEATAGIRSLISVLLDSLSAGMEQAKAEGIEEIRSG